MKMSASSRIYLTNGNPTQKYFASTNRSRVVMNSNINSDPSKPEDSSSSNLFQNNGPSASDYQ